MPFFGHTDMHSPQPLHRSISIIILPVILVLYLFLTMRITRDEINLSHFNKAVRLCKVNVEFSIIFLYILWEYSNFINPDLSGEFLREYLR